MATNSFLHPVHEVHFGDYTPKDVAEALEVTEALARERLEAVLALDDADRTFENTVLAVTRSSLEFDKICGLVSHLESVLGEPWRHANELANERSSHLQNALQFHAGIYAALVAVRDDGADTRPLAPNRKKLLDELILDYERNGIKLDEASQDDLKSLRLNLSKLSVAFEQNVVDAYDAAGVHIATRDELAGLNEAFITEAARAAEAKDLDGYWINYSQPNYTMVMTLCSSRSTREALYLVHIELAAKTNAEVATDILKDRLRYANILGYKNYADYVLEHRMAKNGQTAAAFLADLAQKYTSKMRDEHASLQAFARELENDPKLELTPADTHTGYDFYYAAKQRSQLVGIDTAELRSYFDLERVLSEMFSILTTLYGITFKRVDAPTWHSDVQVYELHDGNNHIAIVWCDWYARPGKHAGAWANNFYVAQRGGGTYERPHLGVVAANLETPVDGRCRLSLRDVETIWHEFGHFVHFAVGEMELPEQSAFQSRWDFVEAPSQIMENWVWQPDVMKRIARHETTGEPLSNEVIDRLYIGRNYNVGIKTMRQLNFGTVDLKLHMEYDPLGEVGVIEYARQIKSDFSVVPPYASDASIMTFSHIFAGGYAAAYYSYEWAQVIEADFFAKFLREGYLNPAVGKDYRKRVLARGSEVEPQELIQDFLGRPASPEAKLKRDGVDT